MYTSQIVSLVVVIAFFAGGMVYFMAQPEPQNTREADCVAGVAALPLMNNATAMGMTAVIAECE